MDRDERKDRKRRRMGRGGGGEERLILSPAIDVCSQRLGNKAADDSERIQQQQGAPMKLPLRWSAPPPPPPLPPPPPHLLLLLLFLWTVILLGDFPAVMSVGSSGSCGSDSFSLCSLQVFRKSALQTCPALYFVMSQRALITKYNKGEVYSAGSGTFGLLLN